METRPGTPFALEVQPRIPAGLGRLEELANNLWYSWHRPTRALFARLNPKVWEAVGYSPKAFLKSVHERQLLEAAEDPTFLHDYNQTLAAYDAYHNQPEAGNGGSQMGEGDLIHEIEKLPFERRIDRLATYIDEAVDGEVPL